jgi:hypothetical protein
VFYFTAGGKGKAKMRQTEVRFPRGKPLGQEIPAKAPKIRRPGFEPVIMAVETYETP